VATCVVYLETNFLVGVATGRESRAGDLLSAVSDAVRVVIPSSCYMEAYSAFEDEKGRRNSFKNHLEHQIAQLRRDVTSSHATMLLARLEEARVLNGRLLGDVQDRLFGLIERCSTALDSIPVTAAILKDSATRMIIEDPTDNLILVSILHHARQDATTDKALLTGNNKDFSTPNVRKELGAVGIQSYFRTAENLLGWIHGRVRS
jgi:hypothetical protein